MAGVRHIRVDPAMGSIGSAALLRSLVHLNVFHNQAGCVETFGLSIRLGVLQKAEEKLGRLDGPPGTRDAKLLALGTSSNATGITTKRHSFLLLLHIFEEGNGACHLQAIDGLSGFSRVLEGHAKIGTASPG